MHNGGTLFPRLCRFGHVQSIDGAQQLRNEGQLQLYEGDAAFRANQDTWHLRGEHGIGFDLLRMPRRLRKFSPDFLGLHLTGKIPSTRWFGRNILQKPLWRVETPPTGEAIPAPT